MTTFTHIAVGTNDLEKSREFYDAVLATLGWSRIVDLGDSASMWGDGKPCFMVTKPRDGNVATAGNGITISFEAPNQSAVRKFHSAALAFGSPDEGAVGPRPWSPNALAAYTRDPDETNWPSLVSLRTCLQADKIEVFHSARSEPTLLSPS